VNRHVANGVEAIAKGEGSFAEAAEEFLTAHDQDGLSWREIDRQIGRGHDYARPFVNSWRRGAPTPFGRGDWEHRKQQIATKTPVKQADRVKMAEELLEDPKVVKAVLSKSTKASRGVTNTVIANEAKVKEDKARQSREQEEIDKASLPGFEARLSTMITKVNEWALALDSTRDDLRDVRPGRQTELVDRALSNLERAAGDSRAVLGYSGKLRVIEGIVGTKKSQFA
jgi:hypothetical protein